MDTQNFRVMFDQIEVMYKKIVEAHKNNQLQKIKPKQLRQQKAKIQKISKDPNRLQKQNINPETIKVYNQKFIQFTQLFQFAAKNKVVSKEFYKQIGNVINGIKSNVDSLLAKNTKQQNTPMQQKDKNKQQNKTKTQTVINVQSQSKLIQSKIIQKNEKPVQKLGLSVLSAQEQSKYEQKLRNVYEKKNMKQEKMSFKKQIQKIELQHQGKKKFSSKLNLSINNDKARREQRIRRLIEQNNELRSKLLINELMQQDKKKEIKVQQIKKVGGFKKQKTLLVDRSVGNSNKIDNEFEELDKSVMDKNLLDVQKYQIYNDLYKKQNGQMQKKMNDVQILLEELVKQNLKLKKLDVNQTNKQIIINKILNKQKSITSNNSNLYDSFTLEQINQYQKNHIKNIYYILPQSNNKILITPQQILQIHQKKQQKVKLSHLLSQRQQQQHTFQLQNSFDTYQNVPSIYNTQNISPPNIHHFSLINSFKNITKPILNRNKVAFFKSSLILIKDDLNYQIAYKKSPINAQFNQIRFIYYINNKTQYTQNIQITYTYNHQHYQIIKQQTATTIKPKSQTRQSLIIKQKHQNYNLQTTFIISNFKFTSFSYDFVLPIIFLKFTQPLQNQSYSTQYQNNITIQPNKQFATPYLLNSLIKSIPFNQQQYNMEFLLKQQKQQINTLILTNQGSHHLKLVWDDGLLKLTGLTKWIHYIGWILAQIKV